MHEARDKPLTKISLGLEYATISACRISLMSPELLDSVLLQTDFPELKLHASGKVRDVYTPGCRPAAVCGHRSHLRI